MKIYIYEDADGNLHATTRWRGGDAGYWHWEFWGVGTEEKLKAQAKHILYGDRSLQKDPIARAKAKEAFYLLMTRSRNRKRRERLWWAKYHTFIAALDRRLSAAIKQSISDGVIRLVVPIGIQDVRDRLRGIWGDHIDDHKHSDGTYDIWGWAAGRDEYRAPVEWKINITPTEEKK